MKKTFYSHGKLLITGEYLVLDGALAFALPTKLGQNLIIKNGQDNEIHWKSYDADKSVWFEEIIPFESITQFVAIKTESIKNTLITILHHAYKKNPNFITKSKGYTITTELSFSRKWGLGTSSTLINNLAQWLEIDAFELLNNSFGGSGYDIACAQNSNPIIYKLENGNPVIKQVTFKPKFTDHIYFVYLNKKQSSKTAITNYSANKNQNLAHLITKNNLITQQILTATTLNEFIEGVEEHESKMSILLETSTVKELHFNDFKGAIKSLGAWGGDFIMVVSLENPTAYFTQKGYETVFSFDELILC